MRNWRQVAADRLSARRQSDASDSPRRIRLWVLSILVVAAVLRIFLASEEGLWQDEVFSLAMATGHSLEHSAAKANPSRGDYVESDGPRSPAELRQYLEHDGGPTGPTHVVRAVLMSDTSPPLYYLLLNPWTIAFGTSDFALRLFSALWALACFPFLWSIASRVGGQTSAILTCVLFYTVPAGLYFSTDGRMYPMVWFLAAGTIWLTLQLHDNGAQRTLLAAWIGVAVAGLLTHYFYAFVLAACVAWLMLQPGKLRRPLVAGAAALTGMLVLPWYALLPRSVSAWRVTHDWLLSNPSPHGRVEAAIRLVPSLLSNEGFLRTTNLAKELSTITFLIIAVFLVVHYSSRLFTGSRLLLILCVGTVPAGLLLFDLARNTHTTAYPRYALAALPALVILAGIGVARMRPALRIATLALIVVAWTPGVVDVLDGRHESRPYPQTAAAIDARTRSGDLVIFDGIPSQILAFARYLDGDIELLTWVDALEQRHPPDDLTRLLTGYQRAVVITHDSRGTAHSAPKAWLSQNTTVMDEFRTGGILITYFVPSGEAQYFAFEPTPDQGNSPDLSRE